MVAASCFGLLIPAMDMTGGEGWENVMPSAVGFVVGALFLYALDKLTPHLHINFDRSEAEGPETDWHRTTLLVLAITLHNIPEGLAVGVLFGGAAAGIEGTTIGGAVALAIAELVIPSHRCSQTNCSNGVNSRSKMLTSKAVSNDLAPLCSYL